LVDYIIRNTTSGGVNVNDVLTHIGNYYLPFGGVGDSGTGSYHGKASFDTFSHMKSVMRSSRARDIRFLYPPYTQRKQKIVKRVMN
jgi:aldehyde dehydrogenase (NAD+)